MESGIQKRLVTDHGVSALISSRVYPVLMPDDPTLPAATYQRASTVRDYTTTGPVSLSRIRLQVDSWGRTYADVKALDAAIRVCLEAFSGMLPDGTYVDSIQIDSSQDLYDGSARYFRISTDYLILAVE